MFSHHATSSSKTKTYTNNSWTTGKQNTHKTASRNSCLATPVPPTVRFNNTDSTNLWIWIYSNCRLAVDYLQLCAKGLCNSTNSVHHRISKQHLELGTQPSPSFEHFASKAVTPSFWLVGRDSFNTLCSLLPLAICISQIPVRGVEDLMFEDTSHCSGAQYSALPPTWNTNSSSNWSLLYGWKFKALLFSPSFSFLKAVRLLRHRSWSYKPLGALLLCFYFSFFFLSFVFFPCCANKPYRAAFDKPSGVSS